MVTGMGFASSRAGCTDAKAVTQRLRVFRYGSRILRHHLVPRSLDQQVEFPAAVLDTPCLEEMYIDAPEDKSFVYFGPILKLRRPGSPR